MATLGDGPERVVGVLLALISLSDFYFRFKLFFLECSLASVQHQSSVQPPKSNVLHNDSDLKGEKIDFT